MNYEDVVYFCSALPYAMMIAKIEICYIQNYGKLLSAHIDKENNVLYVMAERILSADIMVEMSKLFAAIEETEIGSNKHEEFHAALHALKDIYLE